MNITEVIERYNCAAAVLAAQVDAADRMSDPDYVCDRSPRAEQLRAEHARASLAEYRAAAEALHTWSRES